MIAFLRNKHGALWEWFQARADSAHARFWLAALAFTESSFFLIPPDILLLGMAIAHPHRWLGFAILTTLASTAGALFGYLIGAFFFYLVGEPIINFYHLHEYFAQVGDLFSDYTAWVMFIAAFTPIPFKVFVLAGGFFKVDLIVFTVASFIGRGVRFFLVAYISKRFGPRVMQLWLRYFDLVTIGAVGLIVIAACLWYFL